MYIVEGTCASAGTASGKLVFIREDSYIIPKTYIKNPENEIMRFQEAAGCAYNQLQKVYEKALEAVNKNDAYIFVIQQMMIKENGFANAVKRMISEEKVSAQFAVYAVAQRHISRLESTRDEYLMARTADVRDLSQRVINILTKNPGLDIPPGDNLILYKYSLTPSEIIEFDRDRIIALITFKGSELSHSAILARELKIPALTNLSEDICRFCGNFVTVDAQNNRVIIKNK